MNLLQRAVAKVFGLGSSATVEGMPDWAEPIIDRPFTLPPVALDYPNAYRKVGIVRACVDRISMDCAGLPVAFETEGRDGWTPIQRKPLNIVDVWHAANRSQAGIELVRDLHAYYRIAGNAYLVMDTLGTSRVQELWTLAPHLVEPVPGRDRSERGFVFNRGGQRVFIPAENVLHWRAFNPDDEPLGCSALEAVQHAYENRYDSGRLRQNVLRSGGVGSGYFKRADAKNGTMPMHESDRKAAERRLSQMYGGIDAAKRARVLDVWEWVSMGMTPDQLKMLDADAQSDADICRALGVPPWLVGIKEGGKLSDGSGGSNTDERLYWQNTIKAEIELRDRIFTERFCPRFQPGVRMRTDFSSVIALQAPIFNAAQQLVALTGRPVFTVNEMRQALGKPRIDDPSADMLYEKPDPLAGLGVPAPAADAPAGGGAANDGKPASPAAMSLRMIDGDELREERRRVAKVNLGRFERRLARFFSELLDDQRKRAVAQIEAMGARGRAVRSIDPEEVFAVTEEDKARVQRILEQLIEERGVDALAELAVQAEVTLNNQRAAAFILSQSQRALLLTEATTRQALREVIARSVDAGESLSSLIERINEMPEFGLARAQTIARTESISAYNFATRDAWEQSGVVEEVEWLSARDSAVRDTHSNADGDTAAANGGTFDVGGSVLRFPGDPAGPPEETVNCRCTLLPVLKSEARGLQHLFAPTKRVALDGFFGTNGVAK